MEAVQKPQKGDFKTNICLILFNLMLFL